MASGASSGGGNAAGMTTQGGFAGASQAGGGNAASAGNGGAAGGTCFGFGCAGGGGFGGSFGGPYCANGNSCAPCTNNTHCPYETEYCSNNVCVQCSTEGSSQCWPGATCDVLVGRCVPACDRTSDCPDERVCDLNHGTCVWCIDDRECDGGEPKTCYFHRCVDCTQDADCNEQGGSRRCFNLRCVQPCVTDKDCDPNGRSHCDVKGFCE
jgi:hypothetical protein